MAIDYIYYPTIQLGPITIFTWGLLVAIGFLTGILLAVRYGKKIGLKEDNVYGLCFYILLGSIIGARLLFVLTNLGTFTEDPLGVFKVWQGGMDFIGGLGGGVLAAYLFVKIKKLNFWTYSDLVAPYIALGHALGRLGCVLGDGGHLGKPTDFLWGIAYEGVVRHPGALYEMIALIGLFIFLIEIRKRNLKTGTLFFSYIWGYSILRFGIDFLRADRIFYGLTGTQWGLIGASIFAAIMMRKISKKEPQKEEIKLQLKQEKKEEANEPVKETSKDELTIIE
ncbi:MAG: prolipoprotein diacylglyceryl transferase [archaeon]